MGIDNDLQIFLAKTPMRNFSSFATFIFFVTQQIWLVHLCNCLWSVRMPLQITFCHCKILETLQLLIFIIQQSGFVH